ncbi:MAG TPA: hypothetical protein VHE35_36020 [Kofleriaceae bacterium]|nr:hypothetical protein [Kofleriaceae bacterium]
MRTVVGLGVLGALAVLGAGCGDGDTHDGDPFPIYAGRAAGAFTVGFTSDLDPGGAAANPAVVDVLSPVTVIDLEGPPPRRGGVTLTMLAPPTPGAATTVPRARFDTTALLLHPCSTAGACPIGDPASPTPIGAVIGADTLRDDAIRFEPDTSRMFVFDQIAGSDQARDDACDALLPAPFYGGGTLVVGDTELSFDGLRIAVDVCLQETPPRERPIAVTGTDAAMVLSSGIGVSILGEARYEQWRQEHGGEPLASLPATSVMLPSGPVSGRLATIPAIDIAGGGSSSRGACHDAYANRLLTARNCLTTDDCPCGGDPFCAAPAVLELVPATPIDVVVVPDTDPTLQALRAELRPARPEVDGILGMNALGGAVLDVDYPHNRVLFRCVPPPATCTPDPTAPPACLVRPTLRDAASRPVIEACVAAARCETPTALP